MKRILDFYIKMTERLGSYYVLVKLLTDLKGFVESIQFLIDLFYSLFK